MKPNFASAVSVDEHRQTAAAVEDLVLVSNREPYRHEYDDGEVVVEEPAGGLASGIDPVMQRIDGTWIAWGDGAADFDVTDEGNGVRVPPDDPAYRLQRLTLSTDQVDGYYEGYANRALWPLCHSMPGRAMFNATDYAQYRAVNGAFADAVTDHATDRSTVWFQDYHFALAPRMVRAEDATPFLMHFLHVPWPAPEVFEICPQGPALLDGLLGNDFVGFHVSDYCRNFLNCADRLLDGTSVDHAAGTVTYRDRRTRVAALPFAVDAEDIRRTAAGADASFWRDFRTEHGIDADTTVALGVDRLDYTKGIPARLDALERFFETRPHLQGALTYVQKGCLTREGVPEYDAERERIEHRIEKLNDRFGTDDWTPVVYTTGMYDRPELFILYRNADIAMVSPLRDGMNLVAKEYVASQVDDDGVLLLSPLAGASEQLGAEAVEFDPYDTASAAAAIERAVGMHRDERQARMRALRRSVHEADLSWWLDEVLRTAATVRASRTEGDRRERRQ
jgi:trehalose 6-phosphate synthase